MNELNPLRCNLCPKLRLAIWIALLALLLPGQLAWLWLLRGPRLLSQEGTLIWGQALLGLACIALLWLLKTTPADAIRLPARWSTLAVVGGAILLQTCAVVLLAPVLSDDVFRYRLDGRMWLSGASPYATTPDEFLAHHRADEGDALVPYRDWHTVYPPVSQAVFAVVRWVDDALCGPPAVDAGATRDWRMRATHASVIRRTLAIRGVFALMVASGVLVMTRVLVAAGASPWWAVILGWNPLVTLESGGMGHQDALGALFLIVMVLASRSRRPRTAAFALALACGVKPVAGLLLPFLWRQTHEEQSFRAGRRMLLVFFISVIVICMPLGIQHGWSGWRETVLHFGHRWEANGLFYESFKALFGSGDQGRQMERTKDAARLLAMLAVLAMGLFLWQSRARLAEAGYWLFMVLLLCAPVAYPWYLIWILAFVPLLRGPQGFAGLMWASTAAMSYTLWRDAEWIWSVRPAWLIAEYLPVLAIMAIEVMRLARIVPIGRALGAREAVRG